MKKKTSHKEKIGGDIERKSIENVCDYCRTNGKCGRALCDNFGKQCTGRSCEDWKCEAEGEEEVKVKGEGEQRWQDFSLLLKNQKLNTIVHLHLWPSPKNVKQKGVHYEHC